MHSDVKSTNNITEGAEQEPSLDLLNNASTAILVKILGTSHKIALLQSLITCPPLPPFQCCLNQTPFDHLNIELGGKGD